MTDLAKQALIALNKAVQKELERKAKLGYNAVIGDEHGNPKEVSAKSLLKKRKVQQ